MRPPASTSSTCDSFRRATPIGTAAGMCGGRPRYGAFVSFYITGIVS
jgi:hypothetical protein